MSAGRFSRPIAMRQPGMFLSQPGIDTFASYHWPAMTVSIESAIRSRDWSEKLIPSVPIEIASLTPTVLKRMPTMPAAATPSFTCSARSSRCMLQGLPSNQTLEMPTCGLSMSASVSPVPYSIACDAPCDLGCVTRALNLLSCAMPSSGSLADDAARVGAVNSSRAELFFDAKQLVVLGDPFGPRHRSGLDVPGARRHGEVRDEGIFRFAGAMRDDGLIAGAMRRRDRIECFRHGSNLIELDEHRVPHVRIDALADNRRVRHEHVVAHEHDPGAEPFGERAPPLPVVFGQAILDRHDRESIGELLEEIDHLGARQRFQPALGESVLAVLVQFAARAIQRQRDVATRCVTGLSDGLDHELQRLVRMLDVRRVAALVADRRHVARILQNLAQDVKRLGEHPDRVAERRRSQRHEHEFLEVESIGRVRAAIDDVRERHRQRVDGPGREVAVQREPSGHRRCARRRHRHAEQRVRPEARFVPCAVRGDERAIDGALISRVDAAHRISQRADHVADRFAHAFAAVAPRIAVAKLERLARSCRGARRHGRAAGGAVFEPQLHFDSRIAARIQNLARHDRNNAGTIAHGPSTGTGREERAALSLRLLRFQQDTIRAESMPVLELVTSTGLGSLLGMRHALEPDHLAAVSTLVAEERDGYKAAWLGACWGAGHTLTLLVVGAALVVLRTEMPPPAAVVFELFVALMLIGLGLRALAVAARQGPAGPIHEHHHGQMVHVHRGTAAHIHVGAWTLARRPLLVGAVHGLAGSGALTALVLTTLPTPAAQLTYMLVFGLGSTLGMAALSGLLGWPLARAGRHRGLARALSLAVGGVSTVLGFAWGLPILGKLF